MNPVAVRPGRTRKNVSPGEAPADVQLNVRMTNAQKRRLDVMAGMVGISKVEFVRRVLDERYTVMTKRADVPIKLPADAAGR